MRISIDGLEVLFPYEHVYKEQYLYMRELKKTLDAKGDAILEMPTGTGKTVSLLALIIAYQEAYPSCGKLIYCTRTVPEMVKAIEELKRVCTYRATVLGDKKRDVLAVCLSARRNMCIHADVAEEADKEKVDAACRGMTASWVRTKAETDKSVRTCDFFEGWAAKSTDAELRGAFDHWLPTLLSGCIAPPPPQASIT